jgi:hypothetical protein
LDIPASDFVTLSGIYAVHKPLIRCSYAVDKAFIR